MISIFDICIVIGYLTLIILIGYACSKSNKNTNDFFLASKSMPWIPVACSICATLISANSFIGGPGWAYTDGIAPFMVNVTVPFACFLSAWIVAPLLFKLKVTTIYEYIGNRFGEKSKLLLIIHYFINSLIQISSMIFIPTLILQAITGLSFSTLVIVLVAFTIAYTSLGGIKAVIWTDTMQMLVVFISIFSVIFLCVKHSDIGFFRMMTDARASGKLNALDFSLDMTNTNGFWATLLGGSLMWIKYFSFDQTQVQRILASKNLEGVKRSYLASSILMNLVYFVVIFVGILLWYYFEGTPFENSNDIMITFILHHLPIGITGISVSGILASVMSSVDSMLNSMTTVAINDLIAPYVLSSKNKEVKKGYVIGLSFLFGICIIIFIMVGFQGTVKSVLDVVGNYVSYFLGPIVAIFTLGLFSEKANDTGVFWGTLISMFLTYAISSASSYSWMWNPLIGFILAMGIGYLISIVFRKQPAQLGKKSGYCLREILEFMSDAPKSQKPFYWDKYSIMILLLFVLQYAALAALGTWLIR